MEELIATKKRAYKLKTVLYILGMSFGSMAYGYVGSIIATTLGQPSFLQYMGLLTDANASALFGAIVSLFYVGGFLGALVAGNLSDRYGRRPVTFAGALITLIGDGLMAGSVNPAMFIASRFVTGFGGTICFTSVPLWITEIVPPRHRGILVDIHPIMINFGYCLAAYTGVGFFYYTTGNGNEWRYPIAIACLPCLLCMIAIPFVPESPRYLLMQGKREAALKIIQDLHSRKEDVNHEYAALEFQEIEQQIEIDRTLRVSYWGMFKRPSYRRRIFIGCGLIFYLACSGSLVINNYSTALYAGLGYDSEHQLLFSAGWVAIALGTNILATLIVDRISRPTLITIGFLGCLICLTCEAAIQAKFLNSENAAALTGGVVVLDLFAVFYGLFLDGSTFFYLGEIFPNHLRAQGMTLGLALFNLITVIFQSVAPTAFANIGWKFYLIFITTSATAVVLVPLTFPETRNKPLEDIGRLFGDDDITAEYNLNAAQYPADVKSRGLNVTDVTAESL